MPTKTRRVRDHTQNPNEYTGVTRLGRQLGPGVREQRARKAKRTRALRQLRARLAVVLALVASALGFAGATSGQPLLVVSSGLSLLLAVLFGFNTPTRRRKRGGRR